MIHLTERTHVLDEKKVSGRLSKNAYNLWNGKAIFEWEVVQLDILEEPEEYPDVFGLQCSQAAVELNVASLWNPLSDTVTLDSFDKSLNGANQNPTLGRCVVCNSPLDADGLCRPCLLLGIDFPLD